jgi:hypothetical protein
MKTRERGKRQGGGGGNKRKIEENTRGMKIYWLFQNGECGQPEGL